MTQEQSQASPSTQAASSPISKVLLVGHCGFDSGSLTHLVRSSMNLSAKRVNSDDALAKEAGADTLLLINRVLDGQFKAGDGVELIQQLASQKNAPKMMVITNYPDVLEKSVAAGALPGFGKNDISSPDVSQRLKALTQKG